MKPVILLCGLMLLISCGSHMQAPSWVTGSKACPPYATIEYVDALKINDIRYTRNFHESDLASLKPSGQAGEVGYMLSGHACSDYELQNGDAALLPEGTVIYAVEGYNPEFRLLANGELYESANHSKAKVLSDLMDIQGKITGIRFEGTDDGAPLSGFSPEAVRRFEEEFLKLPYIGFGAMYKQTGDLNRDNYFLRVHLQDGSSFRISYWPGHRAITPGAFVTETLDTLIQTQKKAAP
ncbi:hypothetical protein [Paenibacillus sp. y28]|uniref:hypothetical protein n=1 Tax=Paenibacillus sp. y28 TaxID=3129110 RepID=UPI0030189175